MAEGGHLAAVIMRNCGLQQTSVTPPTGSRQLTSAAAALLALEQPTGLLSLLLLSLLPVPYIHVRFHQMLCECNTAGAHLQGIGQGLVVHWASDVQACISHCLAACRFCYSCSEVLASGN